MSPENDTPQNNDEPTTPYDESPDAVIEAAIRRYGRGRPIPSHLIAMSVMHDLKFAGFEITKRTELGVTKGLPGIAESLTGFVGKLRSGYGLDGLDGSSPHTTPAELFAALELIGKQPDVVAVKLPEPDRGPDGCGQYVWRAVGDVTAVPKDDGSWSVWDEDFEMTPDDARDHAAALLAAAARAEAADGAQ